MLVKITTGGSSVKHTDTEKKLTTSQLLSIIKKSGQFSEVTNIWQDEMETPVFCHYLYETMEKHKLTAKDIISAAASNDPILSSSQRFKTPGRNIVLRICLCMEATLTETSQLLRLAGHGSLYPKVRRDAAIIFAIEKKYTMQQANELLLSLQETPLYRESND